MREALTKLVIYPTFLSVIEVSPRNRQILKSTDPPSRIGHHFLEVMTLSDAM